MFTHPLTLLLYELLPFAVSFVSLSVYQMYMHWRASRDPNYSVYAANQLARRRWVESVMETAGHEVLAVQTLRNSVMASSFMASTVVLLIMAVLNLSADWEKLSRAWQGIGTLVTGSPEVHIFNIMLLILDYFGAFFFFSMAVRYYSHVGYMINISPHLRLEEFTPDQVACYLDRAGGHYHTGIRTFLFSLPLMSWFFGPQYLLLSTLVLILTLYAMDRTPRESRFRVLAGQTPQQINS